MCGHCGCGENVMGAAPGHAHGHPHGAEGRRVIELERSLLEHNARLAERLRGIFWAKGIVALNLLSSPGAGKTALLEATFREGDLRDLRMGVIVGDLATDRDAARLTAVGARALQITTGDVCHLDAHMLLHALEELDLDALDLLFLENVGNLVCPAAFDLGESLRVVLTSVTEGEDKPLKYPTIFRDADLVVITKCDLNTAVGVDLELLRANLGEVAPRAEILELSAKTGVGLAGWIAFLDSACTAKS